MCAKGLALLVQVNKQQQVRNGSDRHMAHGNCRGSCCAKKQSALPLLLCNDPWQGPCVHRPCLSNLLDISIHRQSMHAGYRTRRKRISCWARRWPCGGRTITDRCARGPSSWEASTPSALPSGTCVRPKMTACCCHAFGCGHPALCLLLPSRICWRDLSYSAGSNQPT